MALNVSALATVASGQQISNQVDCRTDKALAIRVPSGGLNGVSSLKFVSATSFDGPWLPVYDDDNVEFEISISGAASAGGQFLLPYRIFGSLNLLKVVTQTTSSETVYTIVQGS